MFCIAICDDCPNELEKIQAILGRYRDARPYFLMEIHSFMSGVELLESIKSGQAYDLYLLDIMMPEITGISLARELREINSKTPVVFLTSSVDYALDSYNVSAIQYLLKPIDESRFFSVLDDVVSSHMKKSEKYFMFQTVDRMLRIALSTMEYIEHMNRVMKLHLDTGEILTSKNLRVSFELTVSPLLSDRNFLYPHKSFVINMSHIRELTGRTFVMQSGAEIIVPRYKIADAKAKYLRWFSGNIEG